jgi:hypothetical protein
MQGLGRGADNDEVVAPLIQLRETVVFCIGVRSLTCLVEEELDLKLSNRGTKPQYVKGMDEGGTRPASEVRGRSEKSGRSLEVCEGACMQPDASGPWSGSHNSWGF